MKALWGLDPFQKMDSKIKRTFELINAMSSDEEKVEIGFIVSHNENDLRLAFNIPEEERFSKYPKRVLEKKLKRAGISLSDVRLHVIDHPTLSTTQTSMRLLKLAKDRRCDLCVVFSQNTSALRKFFIGSFAESMVHLSEQKLLVVNPHSKFSKKIRTVLFCHDNSPSSDQALQEMIDFCSKKGSRLVVLHVARLAYGLPEKNLDSDEKSYRTQVDRQKVAIETRCAKAKVKCKVIISTDFAMISEIALKAAKKEDADLIAVVAKSSRTKAFMGGSVTRQILRESSVPVLVLR